MKKKENVMKIVVLAVLILLQAQVQKAFAGNSQKSDFLNGLKGTYIELFTNQTCLNPKYDALWKNEATKYVDEAKADTAIQQLVGACKGTRIGEEAMAYFKEHGGMQFCCAFQQGVKRFTISGNRITGFDEQGKKLFSQKYHFVEKDANGNYIYESDKKQADEFHYFWFRPDSPAETHHIEFRYGSDKLQLTQLMQGKYAYWMASGVREGHEDEWEESIMLFVGENLGAKE